VDQARGFLHAVREDRLKAAFLIGAVTGMRRGELLGLRWEDVDLEAGVFQIKGSIQRIKGQGIVRTPPKTAASRRKLAIAPFICNALMVHRGRQLVERSLAGSKWVESGYVFTSSTGTAMDPRNLTRRFQLLAEAAGVPRQRFHDLRHFAASVQLMDGAPLNAVQQQLGHSEASTTLDIYAHVSQVVHRDWAERMADLMTEGLDLVDSNCPPNCPPEDLEEAATDARRAI
jgi:integrase